MCACMNIYMCAYMYACVFVYPRNVATYVHRYNIWNKIIISWLAISEFTATYIIHNICNKYI